MKFKHGSLFSGIGGFDLAAEWMGWENVFHCELNEFGRKILKYYWPKAISYEDITKTDFSIHRGKIDILTGGFPCQPYSLAGKRKGKEDARHLWPEMLRAIRETQPRYIVGENVYGITNWNGGLVFNEVQVDLENEGYKVQPCIIPACAVNAPHRRDRVWIVAYSDKCTTKPPRAGEEAESDRRQNNDEQSGGGKQAKQHNGCRDVLRVDTNTDYNRRKEQGEQSENERLTTNFESPGQQVRENRSREKQLWRSDTRNFWKQWPTQSPICSGDDGIPEELDGITFPKWRQESIKAYGNAIVPQVAYQIFKALIITDKPTNFQSYEAYPNSKRDIKLPRQR